MGLGLGAASVSAGVCPAGLGAGGLDWGADGVVRGAPLPGAVFGRFGPVSWATGPDGPSSSMAKAANIGLRIMCGVPTGAELGLAAAGFKTRLRER